MYRTPNFWKMTENWIWSHLFLYKINLFLQHFWLKRFCAIKNLLPRTPLKLNFWKGSVQFNLFHCTEPFCAISTSYLYLFDHFFRNVFVFLLYQITFVALNAVMSGVTPLKWSLEGDFISHNAGGYILISGYILYVGIY